MKTKKSDRAQKRSIIMAPIPHSGGKYIVVAVDGNMQWKMSLECDSKEDAQKQIKTQRLHWKKFNDVIVCNRLATPSQPTRDFDFETAKEQARIDYGSATAFRVGLSAAKLGSYMKNPYPTGSWAHKSFERGSCFWSEQNVESIHPESKPQAHE
jgi:hypothetical protein